MKFKAGDKVQVTHKQAQYWMMEVRKPDDVLTVREVFTSDGRTYVRIEEHRDRYPSANLEAWKLSLAKPVAPKMILSEDPKVRKGTPITTGVLDYFPLAIAEVAKCSKAGNDQHNPGQPLHWAKDKSTDHADCIARHLIDREAVDTDGVRHAAKLAWRALALLQIMLEKEKV